jgi:hypothetical protein
MGRLTCAPPPRALRRPTPGTERGGMEKSGGCGGYDVGALTYTHRETKHVPARHASETLTRTPAYLGSFSILPLAQLRSQVATESMNRVPCGFCVQHSSCSNIRVKCESTASQRRSTQSQTHWRDDVGVKGLDVRKLQPSPGLSGHLPPHLPICFWEGMMCAVDAMRRMRVSGVGV